MRLDVESIGEAWVVAKALSDFIEKGLEAAGFRNPVPNEHHYYTERRALISSLRQFAKEMP